MVSPLSASQLSALQNFGTCTVANAVEIFGVRLRNEGFADSTVRCLSGGRKPIAGYAATVRIRCSNPTPDGSPYVDRTDWWSYLLTIPAPRVVVIQDVDEARGTGSFIGEVHASILKALDCAAVVTDGTVRDLPEVEALGMPIFATGLAVSHAYAHIVDFGGTVEVGGLTVNPGDLLHADLHGVLSIPREVAADLPAAAETIVERERRVLDLCASPGFTLEKLRAAVGGIFD